ncbi:MAG: phosphatase PAP2 family protein, partial [Acidobacteriota bacterium]
QRARGSGGAGRAAARPYGMLWAIFFIVFLILWSVAYAAMPAVRFVGHRLARLVARSSRVQKFVSARKAYMPVVLIVVAGGLLAAWAGDGFIDLAERVRAETPALRKIDSGVHDWAVSHRSAGDTLFFVVMSTVGGPLGLAVLVAIVAGVLAIRRRWSWVIYLAVTTGGCALLNMELKRYFGRARPAVAEMLRRAHGYSFPSGHAMGSAVAFAALAYLAYRAARSWSAAAAALALGATLIASVALSRVYLGVHWISDVAAGITAGLVWVTFTTVAYETLRRIRRLRELRRHPPSAPSAASTGPAPSARL